jgi:hypothetical protein
VSNQNGIGPLVSVSTREIVRTAEQEFTPAARWTGAHRLQPGRLPGKGGTRPHHVVITASPPKLRGYTPGPAIATIVRSHLGTTHGSVTASPITRKRVPHIGLGQTELPGALR